MVFGRNILHVLLVTAFSHVGHCNQSVRMVIKLLGTYYAERRGVCYGFVLGMIRLDVMTLSLVYHTRPSSTRPRLRCGPGIALDRSNCMVSDNRTAYMAHAGTIHGAAGGCRKRSQFVYLF